RGMRGIVLKNHISETASRAALVMKVVPGLEVFGGVVLNTAVGGGNPSAGEWMHSIYGSRGQAGVLPTFESGTHVKNFYKPDAKGLVVAPNGQVTPETEEILKIIARENLVLATGHVHPEEIIAVVRRGRELGVKNMVITHGLTNVPGLTMAQAKEVTEMGAMIEICFLQFLAGPNAPLPFLTHWTQISAKHVAQAAKELGAKSIVISSDLGQSGNMTHVDGMESAVAAVKKEGVSDGDLDLMLRKNPAKLLARFKPGSFRWPSARAAPDGACVSGMTAEMPRACRAGHDAPQAVVRCFPAHDDSRSHRCPRPAGRVPRPSARARLPVRDRDVGALLVLRDAGAARALHGQIPAAPGRGRERGRSFRPAAHAGSRVRAARHPALRVADLRPLYRPRLSHAR